MNGAVALYGLLKQASGLVALVADRIYPDILPQPVPNGTCITYQRLSGGSARGALSDPPLKDDTFQVSVWGKSRTDVLLAADEVRVALDRQRKVTVNGVQVDDCFYRGASDSFDAEARTYFTHLTFDIHYRDPK